jgi:hypothetical protein
MFNYVKFVATKKGMTKKMFSPSLFAAVFGSGMGKNQDPGWVKIRIRDKHPGSATLIESGCCRFNWNCVKILKNKKVSHFKNLAASITRGNRDLIF